MNLKWSCGGRSPLQALEAPREVDSPSYPGSSSLSGKFLLESNSLFTQLFKNNDRVLYPIPVDSGLGGLGEGLIICFLTSPSGDISDQASRRRMGLT